MHIICEARMVCTYLLVLVSTVVFSPQVLESIMLKHRKRKRGWSKKSDDISAHCIVYKIAMRE